MSYTDQEKIEAQLGRDLTGSEETALVYLLGWIDADINDALGGAYGTAVTGTKIYEGGYRTLSIDPVSNVTAVEVLDEDGDVTHTYETDDYVLEPVNSTIKTYIVKRYGRFPCGQTNIRVSGDFGLGAIPDDVVYTATYMACLMLANNGSQGNIVEESIEGYRRKYGSIDWSADPIVAKAFARYDDTSILL